MADQQDNTNQGRVTGSAAAEGVVRGGLIVETIGHLAEGFGTGAGLYVGQQLWDKIHGGGAGAQPPPAEQAPPSQPNKE